MKLRDWIHQDVETFRYWHRPGLQWQKLDGPYYRSSADESEILASNLRDSIEKNSFSNPRMRLAVADIQSNELIGNVSSYWESKETHWLCIGIAIFNPDLWGKGLGWEALGLWVDSLFKSYPKIVRLDMRTWSGNKGLIQLAKKLGFTLEACFRNARIVEGKYFDGLGFGILRDEWSTLNPTGFSARLFKNPSADHDK